MSIRPVPAKWFEILVARDDLSDAAEALAHTGQVELEVQSKTTRYASMPDLQDLLDEYGRLAQRYSHYWPFQERQVSTRTEEPGVRLKHAVDRIYLWQQQADALIRPIEESQSEKTELELIATWLEKLQGREINFTSLTQPGPVLASRLFVVPETDLLKELPPSLLMMRTSGEEQIFLFVVGSTEEVDQLHEDLQLHKGRVLPLPAWLQGGPERAREMVGTRLHELDSGLEQLRQQLDLLNEEHHLREALGDIRQLEWFLANVKDLPVTENFGWLVGWTSDTSGEWLNAALQHAGVRAVVSFPEPPEESERPLIMENPVWAKPFEIFAGMLGTPGENEADPARFLAIIVPLIFGYMFGDVGHGLLLAAAGWFLRSRWPALKILIPCGISAMVFGFVFGSIFGNEHLITPLWLNPIEDPLPILLVPVAGGMLLLLLGLALNTLEAWWRGEFRNWILTEAPLIFMYVLLVAMLFESRAWILFAASFCWYLAGSVILTGGLYFKQLVISLGLLLEKLFQLVINTISFIRVGAFALAHAGLSLAFTVLAEASTNIFITTFILLLGNAIVILLEGLVVSIQTTRLVLFEFFIRFLQATGRVLRPLKAPDDSHLQQTRRTR